ncbi:hypothetical protein ElyMa_000329000 [Elysia marginata]|uniref:Uncharacterized protein n=1 Tax=Elysia marginata TaxID=1093978 RepID=A0AAV4FBK1_9GAST|nr:hypothetical protein ElyMa_000329000 [Elysia marginata]
MPSGIASNGEVSYLVMNLDSALTMPMAVYVFGEQAVKDTKQIVLGNTTVFNNIYLRFCVSFGGQYISHLPQTPDIAWSDSHPPPNATLEARSLTQWYYVVVVVVVLLVVVVVVVAVVAVVVVVVVVVVSNG